MRGRRDNPPVSDPTPVLWVCGPPGVGKIAVAWEVYSELAHRGVGVGYVDIDQLGMCYSEPESDPGRFRMAAENLGAVVAGHRAAGDFGDVCVDTSGLPVDRVVRLVRERTEGWAVPTGPAAAGEAAGPRPPAGPADGPVLWLCGPIGVGKSTAGFDLYLRHVLGRQIPGAFVDLVQLGHYRPAPADLRADHRTKAGILAAMWRTFRAAGAQCLTVVGPAEGREAITAYAEAMPAATITVCRLHAGRDELTRRITLRGQGGSWAQPGDPLKGRPAAHLSSVAEEAVAHAAVLERAAVGDVRIDTDDRTAEEVADAIVAATGWPTR